MVNNDLKGFRRFNFDFQSFSPLRITAAMQIRFRSISTQFNSITLPDPFYPP